MGKPALAMALAYHCVRNNTPLEELHTRYSISQEDMKELMIGVTDAIYTALIDPDFIAEPVPSYWKRPKLLRNWIRLQAVKQEDLNALPTA